MVTISCRVSPVTKTISSISISTIKSLRFSLSFTLGNMDNTSRVGNISASTSIGTMDSRDGSRSSTMDSYSVGNIGDTIANSMVDRGSIADSMVDGSSVSNMSNMSNTISKTSIAKMAAIAIGTIEGISISSNKGCRANLGKISLEC